MHKLDDKPKILIVDDSTEILDVLQSLLKDQYQVFAVPKAAIALNIAQNQIPDLILLDIVIPDMDGYEVCKRLKANDKTKDIPIIFITAKTGIDDEVKGFDVGGVDYITKPIAPPTVLARVKAHLALKREKELLKENIKLREDVNRMTQHDLKTPLNVVINYPQIIKELFEVDEEELEMLNEIETTGYKMLRMINLSLDVYKMETGRYTYEPVSVDIISILNNIMRDHKDYIQSKKISIEIFINESIASSDSEFILTGENLLMYSLFANLIKNALEASPRNEKIIVKLSQDNEWTVSIHNKGAVPPDVRATFFEKYATSQKSSGTGLGTYSAKLMTETLGGKISMETSESDGTIVTTSFPFEVGSNLEL
ncbi:MAG: Two-component hybrid sensor and regulator [Candidatus Magnetoglobus multicellularis str. Araruama]|uniref:histidine kinase n=1 Tax=Candidatus Magnetoglobus multicellularis str. Araruama TaxID=890399 RepID=A0A1V1PEV5_9BACT|nr:MAG: Two-component hybrid sensor and regulator [Candidatus Magnetoglobus multicellularis str. Araruama]